MNKPLSILSKMLAVIGLCSSVLAVGALAVSAYPVYASNPGVESKSKSSAGQQTSHRLSVKDWGMIAKNM